MLFNVKEFAAAGYMSQIIGKYPQLAFQTIPKKPPKKLTFAPSKNEVKSK